MGWLYNQMALPDTLFQAWNKVVSNDGMAGYDKQSITDYSWRIEEHLAALGRQLLTGTYEPQPLLKLVMLKPTGKLRTLLIPTVMDRVAQTAAAIVLTPLVESELGANTFAYRQGLSRMTAAREIERLRNLGYHWVVDADISSFFDTVDHPLLFQRFRELCDDEELLKLISRWLTAQIVDGQNPKTNNTTGLPQGCPISPMLANLYLDKFDERIEKEGFKLVRFADDFLILCKTKPNAEAALELSESALAELKLHLNNEKTRITTFSEGFKYLGYLFIRSLVLPTKMHPEEWYDKLISPIKSNVESLEKVIDKVLSDTEGKVIDPTQWKNGKYCPTPTIIEAALALYKGHSVKDISRSDASAINLSQTSDAITKIIRLSKEKHQKSICFVTGVPGAGKTLVDAILGFLR